MSIITPIALFGWVPVSIFFFIVSRPQIAILITCIGGWLFLPHTSFDLKGLPAYDKYMAVSLCLIIGHVLFGKNKTPEKTKLGFGGILALLWCLCPIATSLSNELGWYNGFSASLRQFIEWGIPFWIGAQYFSKAKDIDLLCKAIVLGGLIYIPFCLFEVKMSPQLSNIIYGFFPHSFLQHMRYGGWRPIVFMQHGLMVALWMALTAVVATWLWKYKEIKLIGSIPISIVSVCLILTMILCKSKGALLLMCVGCFLLFLSKRNITRVLLVITATIPLFMILRITNLLPTDLIVDAASNIFDSQRLESLEFRLKEEDMVANKILERIGLGWGGYGRARVIDSKNGLYLETMDSLWLIAYSTYGLLGLFSLFGHMLYGPWKVLNKLRKDASLLSDNTGPMVLSLIVILFMIDQLLNGMVNPVYILVSGSMASFSHQLMTQQTDIKTQVK